MTKVFSIDGMGTDDLTGITVKSVTPGLLTGGIAAGAVVNVLFNGANYVVPAGKTYTITGCLVQDGGGWPSGTYLSLIYADDAALTTNVVPLTSIPPGAFAGSRKLPICGIAVPTGKYLGIKNQTGTNVTAQLAVGINGFEE